MASLPVNCGALKERRLVAAIDFGTTFSGYAYSLKTDFEKDPLNVRTYHWNTGSGRHSSFKTASCILFDPDKKIHSFGFEAEDNYAALAADEEHFSWFYFKQFKMTLYENKRLSRKTEIKDDKGLKMPAMTVFTECIRYLKDHMIDTAKVRGSTLPPEEMHWVLTVPAIWNDSAKQFMRESAVHAGIQTENLSLALEPEAASIFCRYLPVTRIQGAENTQLTCFGPGTRYLVLDAGGGTVDITVHETQQDGDVREIYKANGGPWGGTMIDKAFQDFLITIAGKDPVELFMKDHRDDYLDLFREFEVKKRTFGPNLADRVTFKIPITLHEAFKNINGGDFRRSLLERQDLKENITFTGDKLRCSPAQAKALFSLTCDHIVSHLKTIMQEPVVKGTNTILMVGGFSDSEMLQNAIQHNFPDKRVIIPEEAGLAVVKGAVIFGHNPRAIVSRVAKRTYGIKTYKPFDTNKHPETKKVIVDGKAKCRDCFDKHVEIGQEVRIGMSFKSRNYTPLYKTSTAMSIKVFTSPNKTPSYVEDPGCERIGEIDVDLSSIEDHNDRGVVVTMIYGDTELGVEAKVEKTGELINGKFNFLG